MSFLGPDDLYKFLNNKIIHPFDSKKIEQAAYELSLGDEAFRTDSKDGKIDYLSDTNRLIEINPGQFTLLLTEETISIPESMLGFISIKAKHKLKGLVNVSGFHVDPGFSGKLLFSVYNAGPATITLKRGERYFLLWFAELKTPATKNERYGVGKNKHNHQNSIDLEYVDALKRNDLASPNVLLERIKQNEASLTNLKWAVGILITLGIVIFGKTFSDSSSFKNGVDYGRKEKIDSIIEKSIRIYPRDSLTLYKVDSLINNRIIKLDDKAKRP